MFGLGIIEVAIGLALVFLSVSLVCSSIREVIEMFSKTRAMDLERGLRELLADKDGTGLTGKLYSHPIIAGLFGGTYDPAQLKATWGLAGIGTGSKMPFGARRTLPSYIPAGHFSAALLDIVVRDGAGSATGPTAFGRAYAAPALSVEGLRATAATLEHESLRRVVLSAIDLSGGELAKVKANLEAWFNGTMDRVAGWYKRRTQMFLFVIGLVVAVLLNVDAITIASRLGSDAALRAAVVTSAEKVVETGGPHAASIATTRAALDDVGFPIGWIGGWPGPQSQPTKPNTPRALTGGAVVQLVLGWLLTAFAVMLGAPFWFDVLNKFMVVRSTVKPHEKSPEKGSEDRRPSSTEAAKTAATTPSVSGRSTAPPIPPPPGYEPKLWNTPGMENAGVL